VAKKEKGLANPTKGFLRISKKKKKLKVARFGQRVPLGRQN
jgi:hypothetical protein